MATYLQGVTDYIPQIQPWTPDYNLYAKVLDFKQSRQDAAVKQLSTLYGSLLNAPLTREDTAETRDKFFKTIDQDIKKMATLDLSKRQNVEAATEVFNQILDNDLFVTDMVYTKHWMSEYQKGQALKGCTDPKKCQGQWWEGGDQYMNFKRMEFKNATPEDALNFSKVNYVAKQDITQKAIDLAKELDIEIEAGAQFKNGFIITGATDDQEEARLYNQIFSGIIGDDPLVREYYKAKAYNNRMNWAYENEQQYGSVDAANVEYINQAYNLINGITDEKDKVEDKRNNVNKQIQKLNQQAGDDIPQRRDEYIEAYQDLVKKRTAYDATYSLYEDAENQGKAALNYAGVPKVSASYMDDILGISELQNDIQTAAVSMAYKKVKAGDWKVNEYELEATKQKNRILFEEMQFENKLILEKYKFDLEQDAKELEEKKKNQGTPNMNNPEEVNVSGSTSVGNLDSDSYDLLTRTYKAFEKDYSGVRADLSSNEKFVFNEMLSAAKAEAETGSVQAKEDYINMAFAYYNGLFKKEKSLNLAGGLDQEGEITPTSQGAASNNAEYNRLVKQINNATTLDEKYRIAKKMNIDLNKLSGTAIDYIYDNKLTSMLSTTDKKYKLRGDMYNMVLKETASKRNTIAFKNKALAEMDEIYAKQANDVIKSSRTGAYKNMAPIFEAYIDPTTGRVRSQSEFVNKIIANRNSVKDPELREKLQKLSKEDIIEIYNGTYEDIEDFTTLEFDEQGMFEDVQLRDIWKAAYTEYVKPEGNKALVPGAGDTYARGNLFRAVDPDAVASNAMLGTTSFTKDMLLSTNGIVSLGTFSETLPEVGTNKIKDNKEMLNQLLTSMTYYKGKEFRPYFDVTFTNVAGGSDDYAGLNIKITNPAFFDKFKGMEGARGDLYLNKDKIMSEGITMYLPKSEASEDNYFVENAKRTDEQKLLDWQGKLELPEYSNNPYIKNIELVKDQTGNFYRLAGSYRVGIDENGNEEYDALANLFPKFNTSSNINDIRTALNQVLFELTMIGKQQDAKFKQRQ